MEAEPDQPIPPDSRFAVELARLLDGRPDPATNPPPPGGPVDVLACLEWQEQLDRIVG